MITIEFRTTEGYYIKQWPNWYGPIPTMGDHIWMHFGDDHLEVEEFAIDYCIIDDEEPDKLICMVHACPRTETL